MPLTEYLRPAARDLDESDIVAVVNRARDKHDLIPFWVGEGDLPTPQFVIEAANASLAAGETFYTWQRGIPELRDELARYHTRVFGIQADYERFFVTGSGMQAIQIAVQSLAGTDDEILMPTPVWPNIHAAAQVSGATPVHVELDFTRNGWSLDLDKFFDSVTERTRAIFVNSPANPTGWVASQETLMAILHFARSRGIWIIADEVYVRFCAGTDRAPSFYDIIEAEDRVIFVNTFSKNWAMTGWRIGWIAAPPELGQVMENMVQYSTSGVPTFSQRAAIAALRDGEPFIAMQQQRALGNLDVLCDGLLSTGRVCLARPQGAFYLFFRIDGYEDGKQLALRLIDEANIGLAPGAGFYTGGSSYLRLCYMRHPDQVAEGTRRLVDWLGAA